MIKSSISILFNAEAKIINHIGQNIFRKLIT